MILLFSWFYKGSSEAEEHSSGHTVTDGVRIRTQSNSKSTVLAIILSPVTSCPRSSFLRQNSLNGLPDTNLYLQLHLGYLWPWVLLTNYPPPLLEMCSLRLPPSPANQGNLSYPSKLILKSKVHFLKQSSWNSQKWLNLSSIFILQCASNVHI